MVLDWPFLMTNPFSNIFWKNKDFFCRKMAKSPLFYSSNERKNAQALPHIANALETSVKLHLTFICKKTNCWLTSNLSSQSERTVGKKASHCRLPTVCMVMRMGFEREEKYKSVLHQNKARQDTVYSVHTTRTHRQSMEMLACLQGVF